MVTNMVPDTSTGGVAVALVVSPRTAALDDARSPRGLLEQVGLRVAEQFTVTDLASDSSTGKRWRQQRYRAIIAAGGDGTIGTTISLLAGTGIPLGILPMGTSNDVARALGIPLDLAAAAAVIANGVPTNIDTGLVREVHGDMRLDSVPTWRNRLGGWLPRWVLHPWRRDAIRSLSFLHAATIGLNAEFAHLASNASRRAALGGFNYPVSSLEALTHLRSIAIKVHLSGVPARDPDTGRRLEGSPSDLHLSLEILQLAVVNTPLFGGTLNLWLPGVDAHDHLLDIFLVEPPRLDRSLDTVRAAVERLHIPRGLMKDHHQQGKEPVQQHEEQDHLRADQAHDALFPGIRRYQAKSVSIETAVPVHVTLDGEVRTKTPVHIQVEPAALAVLLPRTEIGVPVDGNPEDSAFAPTRPPS
jgi:diacylglycerol kinase family enzyme